MAEAKKKKIKKKNKWLLLAVSFIIFLALSVIGGYFSLLYAGGQMIDQSKLDALKIDASVILDKNGAEIGTLYTKESRDYVEMNKIPKHVVDAFVAVEDRRFFEHKGIDIFRIAGAIVRDIQAGGAVEGASTITQQLAKNVFLSNERTFWRKTKEVSISINLEQNFSKDQILEMYLNKIYFGKGVYGVEAASQLYFGKSVSDLDLAQAATLAAIPKAPSTYNPFAHPDKAKERRDTVLRLMNEQGIISNDEKVAAQQEALPTPKVENEPGIKKGYEAYVDYVIDEAEKQYGVTESMLYQGGWKIYTAIDTKVQDAMIKAYANSKNFPPDGPKQQVESGMVVIDPKDGGIAGIMGGRKYTNKGFSYATDMRRQPGSSFKPLVVYAPALDKYPNKYGIYSELSNQKQNFNGYQPNNYDGKYSDTVSMYKAVNKSMNIPAVWLLNEIGVKTGLEYVEKFGIKLTPDDRNLAIALGGLSKGVSPLQMAQAYTAFDNAGVMSTAYSIVKIQNAQAGFERNVTPKHTQVISAQTAWSMQVMMEGVIQEGTGSGARIKGFQVAGKTGTTQSPKYKNADRDAWFVGYTPEYVAAVWMGFPNEDKDHVMRKESGMPAKLFSAVMTEALAGVKSKGFVRPSGAQDPDQIQQTTAPQLAADLTMDNDQMKVVLSWLGSNQDKVSYDVYRFAGSQETKELIASNLKDTIYVDVLKTPILYKYFVVPKDEQGNAGPQSNIAEINMSMLEKMLQDGAEHNDMHPGELPANGQDPEQGSSVQPGDIPSQDSNGTPPDQPQNSDGMNGTYPNGGGSDGRGRPGRPGNSDNGGQNNGTTVTPEGSIQGNPYGDQPSPQVDSQNSQGN